MGLDAILGYSQVAASTIDPSVLTDCLYLMERGIIHPAPIYRRQLAIDVFERLDEVWTDSLEEELQLWESGVIDSPFHDLQPRILALRLASTALHPAGRLSHEHPLPLGAEVVLAYADRLFGEDLAVPLLPAPLSRAMWDAMLGTFYMPRHLADESDNYIVDVVMSRLPTPGDDVSLEAVLDFSRDPETRRQITSLRLWMSEMAMLRAPVDQLRNRLDHMLHEFDQHMRLADMRSSDHALRLAVAVPLEIAQELIHLRPAGALDALFAVRARRASRLEAELQSPGHEVAYVRTAARRFA